jgi:predicted phage baseplate assembly protein
MSCLCDLHHCPTPLAIAAGLACLPRAPGLFPDWRRELLFSIGREPALDDWRAREPGDLGLMLVEMAAYVLDVASFYDHLVANESYLGTARLSGQQRRHVSLLGYLPRPATGASVWLAAEAEGTRLVRLPAGTAIRSGEFNGNPPQVFELEADAGIEPRVNKMEVQRVPATTLPSPLTSITARASSVRVSKGDLVVLDANGALAATRIASAGLMLLRIRDAVTQIGFTSAVTPPAGATVAGSRLLKGGSTCGAWKLTPGSGEPAVLSGAELSLDARLNLHAGDIVLITDGSTDVARRISAVSEVQYTLLAPLTSTITDSANKVSTLLSPAIKVSVTRLTLDAALPFATSAASQLVVHHAMVDAATLHAPLKDTLAQGDPISVPTLMDAPRVPITELLLEDVQGEAVKTTGTLDAASHSATSATAPAWGRELWAPVQLYGNVLCATRGETVSGELLGTGDASQPLQTFRLKKKPLTYLGAANAAGRKSTLVVHVGGVEWEEVQTFFGVDAHAMVYTVRHDDEGHTDIQFGGGARLPSGAPVVADYRFGAGVAVPPADSVKQLKKPVAGLRKLHNPLPAFGGCDAEGPAELAIRGPRSALLLGRAISLVDIETAAAQQPGVRAARAAWRWDAQGLGPAVSASYIGDAQLAPKLQAALRALAEDGAPISAQPSPPQSARLDVDLEIDERHVPGDVIAAVQLALFGAVTLPGTGGLLQPEQLGPDGVVFESVVVRAVMSVAGVASLRALSFDGTPFVETGRVPAAGAYFDFAAGGVWVNGHRAG